jgi:hypothetical protein
MFRPIIVSSSGPLKNTDPYTALVQFIKFNISNLSRDIPVHDLP